MSMNNAEAIFRLAVKKKFTCSWLNFPSYWRGTKADNPKITYICVRNAFWYFLWNKCSRRSRTSQWSIWVFLPAPTALIISDSPSGVILNFCLWGRERLPLSGSIQLIQMQTQRKLTKVKWCSPLRMCSLLCKVHSQWPFGDFLKWSPHALLQPRWRQFDWWGTLLCSRYAKGGQRLHCIKKVQVL